MIRPIMPNDISKVADLAEIMHSEGRYKKVNFNKAKLINNFTIALANYFLVGFVDEREDKIVGAIVGSVSDYFFGDDYILSDYGLFVIPQYRKSKSGAKLLKAFIDAGEKIGVKEVCIGATNMEDPNALDLLYKKVGLTKIGSIYKKDYA